MNNNSNRRDFIKKCGILGSILYINTNNIVDLAAQYSKQKIKVDFDDIKIYFAQNFSSNYSAIPNKYSSFILHGGNFIENKHQLNFSISHLNKSGVAVSSLGPKELQLKETDLVDLLNKSEIPFINSHLDFENKLLKAKIKPYHILIFNDKKIGVIALSSGFKIKQDLNRIQNLTNYLKTGLSCDFIYCLVSHSLNLNSIKSLVKKTSGINLFWSNNISKKDAGNLIMRNKDQHETILYYGENNSDKIAYINFKINHINSIFPIEFNQI